MGTQLIIELDILRHAFAVALLRGVLPAVRLLFFEGSKKRFGDRVVMGPCCSGKGLFNPKLLQQFRKCIRNVLSASVTMKSQIFRISAFGISVPKSCCHKPCTGGAGYTIPNHSTRKQVNDCAKVHPRIFNSEISNIAYCEIGRVVSSRAEKGAAVAASEYLQATYPAAEGFSPRNLRRMRGFYRMYGNMPELLAEAMRLNWTQNVVIMGAGLTMDERC